MNEEGQWIVLMGLLVAVGLFFLALILNQSALVGQTTAEGVLEFPKNDIRDVREAIFDYVDKYGNADTAGNPSAKAVREDIVAISLDRKNAVVDFNVKDQVEISGQLAYPVETHYNNGVTEYDETVYRY